MQIKWIKLCTDIFDDEKILLIESMPDADGIIVIWFKLLCLAGKQNNGGVFILNDRIPYTEEMLASIFRRPVNTVRLALQTFSNFGMIEVIEGVISIPNWEKHQNTDKLAEMREYNRIAQQKSREKRKKIKTVNDKSMTSQECQDIEEEREKEKDKESHSIILCAREEQKREFLGGKLGKGVVLMSDEQFEDLCDKLSYDEINHYFEIVADCELKGKSFKRKTHYQAILDMAAKDRGVVNG